METFVRNCFYPLPVVMALLPWLLMQFRRSLRKSIANSPCVSLFAEQPKYTYQQTVKKVWFLGHHRRKLKKLLKFHRKKSNNWSMENFIHNGGEITTWMGYNFKIKSKSTKSQAAFLRKPSFSNFKLQIIRLAQIHWRCTPTH